MKHTTSSCLVLCCHLRALFALVPVYREFVGRPNFLVTLTANSSSGCRGYFRHYARLQRTYRHRTWKILKNSKIRTAVVGQRATNESEQWRHPPIYWSLISGENGSCRALWTVSASRQVLRRTSWPCRSLQGRSRIMTNWMRRHRRYCKCNNNLGL